MSYAADSLTIDEVMEPESGRLHRSAALIGADYAALIRLRSEIENAIAAGAPMYVCPACAAPVMIRCVRRDKAAPRLSRDFHFWHGRGTTKCLLSHASGQSREAILAAKYHGQREGREHIRLKQLIFDSLRCDSRFTEIAVEGTWRLEGDHKQWRRPDVSAVFDGQPVVFEIQLSTTFVSVMAERRHFYKERGALLVWIVAAFDDQWAALAHEDIFYPNNRNIFVAGENTLSASRDGGAMMLDVHWLEPYDKGSSALAFRLQHALVPFAGLVRDIEKQRIYYFDTDAAEKRFKAAAADAPLRDAFERHWFAHLKGVASKEETHQASEEWSDLRRQFSKRKIDLPTSHYDLEALLNSIYSARDAHKGKLVGWGYSDLVKLAHHLYQDYKAVLWPFRLALNAFDRAAMIREADTTGRWRRKVPLYLRAIVASDPAYALPEYAVGLLSVLFPVLAPDLNKSPQEVLAGTRYSRPS